MTRILLSSALLLSFAAPAAFAQTAQAPVAKQHRAHNPHKAAMRMSKKLGLSQDQTAKLEPILADRRAKMQALRADATLTPDQKMAQRKDILQNTRSQMANVLTPDQMNTLKQMHRDHKRAAKAQS